MNRYNVIAYWAGGVAWYQVAKAPTATAALAKVLRRKAWVERLMVSTVTFSVQEWPT
jgi:(2Fe-2S) ferredoxin